jgi:carbon storage regulator CsrA
MLVLTRKLNQKVIFPGFGAAVQVLSVRAGAVRLGIDAPAGVIVLREELLSKDGLTSPVVPAASASPASGLPRELAHHLRNRLHAATLGLALLRKQWELGLSASASTLDRIDQAIAELRQQMDAAQEQPAPTLPAPAPRRRKALLVEDDTNERELLAGLLRLAGLDVATVGDGLDALNYLHGPERPDVVLLDMGLPRCDGAATVKEIRRDPVFAGLKVFAVTGRSPEEFPGMAESAGINRWFRKPVNPEALLRELTHELADLN